jgi:hypothetical protein
VSHPRQRSIPTRKQWLALKKQYGVADGAVKGINVGAELDKYWKSIGSASGAKGQAIALGLLEPKLAEYISKLDKSKVKKYAELQKKYLDEYVGQAHYMREELKRLDGSTGAYKKQLTMFFGAVQHLDKKKTTKSDLDKFRQGPVRGVTAAGKTFRGGIDVSDIDKWLGTIDTAVLKMSDKTTQNEIANFVDATIKTAEQVAKLAKAKDLA